MGFSSIADETLQVQLPLQALQDLQGSPPFAANLKVHLARQAWQDLQGGAPH